MHFRTTAVLALATVATASATPDAQVKTLTSPRPRSPLDKQDSYDCKGSGMCKSLQVRACDNAVNTVLIRNNDINYGAPGYVITPLL